MSSAATALPSATPAKSPKRKARTQRKTGIAVSDLILKAVSSCTDRGGMSLAALKKTLKSGGYDVVKNRSRIVLAIRRLVANKSLTQIKGKGASGSFKLNKNPPTPRKKKAVKKKPKAKKVKRTRAKKAAGGATPAAKKSPKKKRKTKSPKKAKRPAAAKKSRKPRSPKKVKRRVTKTTRTRAAPKK